MVTLRKILKMLVTAGVVGYLGSSSSLDIYLLKSHMNVLGVPG